MTLRLREVIASKVAAMFRSRSVKTVVYGFGTDESTPFWDVATFKQALTVYDVASAAPWAVQPTRNTDSPLFASKKKAIDAFRSDKEDNRRKKAKAQEE